jgi:hypothetical protein
MLRTILSGTLKLLALIVIIFVIVACLFDGSTIAGLLVLAFIAACPLVMAAEAFRSVKVALGPDRHAPRSRT